MNAEQTYSQRARQMSDAALIWTINDVMVTLDLWKDEITNPYMARLWHEFDAYTGELRRRRQPR